MREEVEDLAVLVEVEVAEVFLVEEGSRMFHILQMLILVESGLWVISHRNSGEQSHTY